jgi:hypothetical protein
MNDRFHYQAIMMVGLELKEKKLINCIVYLKMVGRDWLAKKTGISSKGLLWKSNGMNKLVQY